MVKRLFVHLFIPFRVNGNAPPIEASVILIIANAMTVKPLMSIQHRNHLISTYFVCVNYRVCWRMNTHLECELNAYEYLCYWSKNVTLVHLLKLSSDPS